MMVQRKNLETISQMIQKLSNKKFNIETQYKFIKLKKAIQEEQDIFQEQLQLNCQPFFETDEEGNPVMNNVGGFKIKKDKLNDCSFLVGKMTSMQVQLPDIYFTLDELKELNLTLDELLVLEPFVKN